MKQIGTFMGFTLCTSELLPPDLILALGRVMTEFELRAALNPPPNTDFGWYDAGTGERHTELLPTPRPSRYIPWGAILKRAAELGDHRDPYDFLWN